MSLPFLSNPKDLDLSCKMDQDFWDCFGMKKLILITEEVWYDNFICSFYSNIARGEGMT